MSIEIDPSSSSAILKLKRLDRLTKEGVEFAAFTSANGLRKSANTEILKKPKTGRIYIRRDRAGRRRRHQASAAGESHANLTGTLRKAISFKASNVAIEFGYGVLKNDAPAYAARIEFGQGSIQARNTLSNAIRSERRNFQNNFDREIGKRLGTL